ncbi:KAP family NTPase [Yersinia ruckeri]|uniref:KAP family P-loop NTPase fold protein n=1 Tax=Yersinia ruckeri TaxID=29486 RepID=UPI0022648EF5|nr:P-loop NTPase fold protein [Yersinia ruckeri]UZX56256.1 KAP family NTPase [Yersinia ruckeri]
MRLTIPELDYSNGFTTENDIFKRKKLATQLENIILNAEDDSLVFAIDDEWGNGKTTFLKLWENTINNDKSKKLKIIYFDAFENDFQQDAFLAIATKIYQLIDDKSLKSRFIEGVKSVGKNFFSIALKSTVAIATGGIVNGTVLESVKDNIQSGISDPIEKYIEDKIISAEDEKDTLEHFKETLRVIAEKEKVIFIIDELDRARPDFSLEILEKIKHVFSTKNFVFILSLNKDQFEKIINKKYGNIDSKLYLSKFINYWFKLPTVGRRLDADNTIEKYSSILYTKLFGDKNNFMPARDILTHLLVRKKASLRDVERCYTSLTLLASSTNSRVNEAYQTGLSIVAFLATFEPLAIDRIKNKNITPEEMNKILGIVYSGSLGEEEEDGIINRVVTTELITAEEYSMLVKQGANNIIVSTGIVRQSKIISASIDYLDNMYIE